MPANWIDHLRVALVVALVLISLLIWEAWRSDSQEREQARQEAIAARGELPELTPSGTSDLPAADSTADTDLPTLRSGSEAPGTQAGENGGPDLAQGRRIAVETDLMRVEIDTLGADLRALGLKQHRLEAYGEVPYPMLSDASGRYFFVQSGLLAAEGAPNHQTPYRYDGPDQHRLQPGQDRLELQFVAEGAGLRVEKTYTFNRGSYVVGLDYRVQALNGDAGEARVYAQLQRRKGDDAGRSLFNPVSFQGGAYFTDDSGYEKVSYGDMTDQPLQLATREGWAAMMEHYFVAAVLPPQDAPHHILTRALSGERYVIGTVSEPLEFTGDGASYRTRLYAGPKEHDQLREAADHLVLTVDYGMLTFLAEPLFWVMRKINSVLHNWGFTIIAITMLIKLAFFQLSATSYRSMAHMRRVQPRLMALRDRYKDDRSALNQKMMELYKEEKINPLGGCLPILVQIPVFIALYWVLLESVELRHAPFILWIDDLSSKDPLFILPILMGISMVAQQRLNPAPMDPVQARIMMVLPVVFTVFFAFFPAGLVLYWLANNVLSIAQQWVITRRIEAAAKA